MSDRLNKSNRSVLLQRLTDKAYKTKFDARDTRKRDFFDRWHADYFRANAKWMAETPKKALPELATLKIKLRGDNDVTLRGARQFVPYDFYEEHKYSYQGISWDALSKKLTAKFAAELKAFLDECVALDLEYEKFKGDAKAILDSVTTVKRLYEMWPELAELAPPVVDQTVSVSKQLAPVTTHLNKALGLVPKGEPPTPKPLIKPAPEKKHVGAKK